MSKNLKAKDLRANSVADLKKRLQELNKEKFNQKILKASAQLEKTHVMRETKKSIARVKTLLNEKAKEDK